MTIKELHEVVAKLVAEGKGDEPVLFDTEARTFHCHYIDIDDAIYEDSEHLPDGPFLGLYTRYH